MTRVEIIRKAAALMRERAKAATGAGQPWFIADCEVYRRWILTENGHVNGTGYNDDVIRVTEEDEQFEVADADWDHITGMDPQVALAVADWLETVADGLSVGLRYDGPQALAVAEAYLGVAS